MNPPVEIDAITTLLEKGGLPGLVVAAIYLIWRFAPDRKTPEPAAQVVDALNELKRDIAAIKHDVGELSDQTIDRLARVETEVKNLKERR
jgi:hypothetical protein